MFPKSQLTEVREELFTVSAVIFKKDFIYLFLERGEGRENKRDRNIDHFILICILTGDLAYCSNKMHLSDDHFVDKTPETQRLNNLPNIVQL